MLTHVSLDFLVTYGLQQLFDSLQLSLLHVDAV